jgi:hypothetical protein
MDLKVTLHPHDLEQMLRDAKAAHTAYEKAHPERDHSNWETWYAGFIFQRLDKLAFEQWQAGRSVRDETRRSAGEQTVTDLVRAVGKFATGPTAGE